MSDRTISTTVAEPFSERDEIEIQVGDDDTATVAVGDRYEQVRTPHGSGWLPAEVVNIYMDPQGLPGGRFETADGHKCIPKVVVEYDPPEGHEYEHLAGDRNRIENYNADYCLGLRLPEWDDRAED